jgi:hypothetical protein
MGTRNLTVVKNSDGATKIALYGQWDGYPQYSGIKALEFLRDKTNRDNLLAKLDFVQFITDEECDTIYKSFDKATSWDNKEFLTAYPGLHRDTGIDILSVVANAVYPVKTIDNTEFANDTLFCEGIYEVDFSTNTFTSTWNGAPVIHSLDNLPSDKSYLKDMGLELLTVA